jgi:hypothetical protein
LAQMADIPGRPVAIAASAIFLRDRTAIDQLLARGAPTHTRSVP